MAQKINMTLLEYFLSQIYTTNVRMDGLLHDIPQFLVFFLKQLFFIFNQMLSIGSFGRRVIYL